MGGKKIEKQYSVVDVNSLVYEYSGVHKDTVIDETLEICKSSVAQFTGGDYLKQNNRSKDARSFFAVFVQRNNYQSTCLFLFS